MTQLTSFPKSSIQILLLGGIHRSAEKVFRESGYTQIEMRKGELTENELLEIIPSVHILGIRSGTTVTERVLEKAKKLLTIGCFCIGTNQVDLPAAKLHGIPVFNAPFANTRSVAELVIAETIMLMRNIPARNAAAHRGEWQKSAAGSVEVRGKTLGIVGYGHIGTQVGILAEALGMHVIYFDTASKLSIGNATPVKSLHALLADSDIVTLHVPGGAATKHLIGAKELQAMKSGSSLINASRGQVVDIKALEAAIQSKHIAGAALDVHPEEPSGNGAAFESPLRAFDNVILTPHIAGSTAEAQERIGSDVARSLQSYSDTGATAGAVNFLSVALPSHAGRHRILHIHRNQPGVLAAINDVFAKASVNIASQFLETDADIGYVVTDVDQKRGTELKGALSRIPGTIRTRILY
jgi:D-3-phosphoglycerate dehydrogenase